MPDVKERIDALMQPGVLRALRAVSVDAFEVLQRRLLSEAAIDNQLSQLNIRLAAHLLREFNTDPILLKIGVTNMDKRLDAYDQRRLRNSPTPWNQLKSALGNKGSDRKDWLTIFATLCNAIEGKEREYGFELVECALKRPDACIEAIEQFPKVFRSARGDENTHTALWCLARGTGSTDFSVMEAQRQEPGLAIKEMTKIIRALRSTNIRETGESLVIAAMSIQESVRESFFAAYGKEAVLAATDGQGLSAVHKFAVNTTNNQEGNLNQLIAMDAPLLIEDANHRTPLMLATMTHNNSTNVDALLRAKAYTLEQLDTLVGTANRNQTFMPDPQVRALILAEKARVSIDAMDIFALRRETSCA